VGDVAPVHLSERSAAFWREVVETYDLEIQHLEFRRACEAMDVADQARAELAACGTLTITTRHGEVRAHPCVAIERDARLAVARLLREIDLEGEPLPDPRMPRRG
jgi:phage terminase small subunit